MTTDAPPLARRIAFVTLVLGILTGLAVVCLTGAFLLASPGLAVVALAQVPIAIPMLLARRRLVAERRREGGTGGG